MGPEQLMLKHGDRALRRNDLVDATTAYVTGSRYGGNVASQNFSRIGMVLVARKDEETGMAARALDGGYESQCLARARFSHERAKVAFDKSLSLDSTSEDAALAYFGSAECLVAEGTELEAQSKRDRVDRSGALEKLRRKATQRYSTASALNPYVQRDYDRLLPAHLDTTGLRTLPHVHRHNVQANNMEAANAALARRDAGAALDTERPIGFDCWSEEVSTRAPPGAAAGQHDEDGALADAELAAFKAEHDGRMAAAFKQSEVDRARLLIQRRLLASRLKAQGH